MCYVYVSRTVKLKKEKFASSPAKFTVILSKIDFALTQFIPALPHRQNFAVNIATEFRNRGIHRHYAVIYYILTFFSYVPPRIPLKMRGLHIVSRENIESE